MFVSAEQQPESAICVCVCVCVCVYIYIYIYIYHLPLESPSNPTPLGHNRELSQAPTSYTVIQLLPTSYMLYHQKQDSICVCVCMLVAQLCPTLCNPTKYICMCACALSGFRHVPLYATPWTVALQAPLSMGFSMVKSVQSCTYTGEEVFKNKDCFILLARYILVPRGGNGNPLQNSCLENPIHREALWATVYGAAESGMTEHTFPGNSHVKIVTPSPSECSCIWRKKLSRGS